jgi:hypothetical protein
MVTKKKKETTIDDLALMIRKGFEQVDKRFEKMDERFDRMDARFDRMDSRMDSLEESNTMEHEEMKNHLNNVAYRFELTDLGKRVRILEKKIK